MGRRIASTVLLNVLTASWLLSSAFVGWNGNADYFERLGAWGVAVSIIYFIFFRSDLGLPDHAVRRMSFLGEQGITHSKHLYQAYSNAAIAAHELNKTRAELGLEPSKFCSQMTEALKEGAKKENLDYEAYQIELRELAENEISANEDARLINRVQMGWQNTVAVIATLQWGFGELAIEAIGWSAG